MLSKYSTCIVSMFFNWGTLKQHKAECADVILVPDSPFPLPFAFHLYDFLLLMAKTAFLGLAHALKCPEVTLSMVWFVFKMLCAWWCFLKELQLMYLQKQLMLLTVTGLSQQLTGAILCYVRYSWDNICTVRAYELSHLENVKCDHVFFCQQEMANHINHLSFC